MFKWVKNNFYKILLFGIFLCSSIFIYKYLIITKPKAIVKEVNKKVYNVKIIKSKPINFEPKLTAYGKIISQRNGNLRFGVFGKVNYISPNLLNGAIVKKGEILAKLDPSRFDLAIKELNIHLEEFKKKLNLNQKSLEIKKLINQLEEKKIQLNLKQKQIDRNEIMLIRKVISPSNYENDLISFSKLKSEKEKISYNLKKARDNYSDEIFKNNMNIKKTRLNIEKAQKDLDDTILRSEFDGLISNVKISLGQFVSNSDKIADIKSMQNKEVEFIIPASIYSISKTLINKDIKIVWETSGKELFSVNGKIVRDEGISRENQGGGKMYATLSTNNNNIPLGSFVKIIYPLNTYYSVIKLPETAIFNNNAVFIENKGYAKKVFIKLKYRGEGIVLIDGTNLSDKKIIVNRFSIDIDKKQIKVFE